MYIPETVITFLNYKGCRLPMDLDQQDTHGVSVAWRCPGIQGSKKSSTIKLQFTKGFCNHRKTFTIQTTRS